jgi:dienelactone hydrolase
MSEGSYPSRFYINDGDPTYKARVHAQDIVPAIDHLRSLPAIDARRIVLAGHSAGGFSAAYIAGTNPPGVIAAVDFSGGRTDATQTTTAGPWSRTMIRGFEEIGRTSRVPTLFLFAENDPLYAAETIRGAYAAFVQAGGKGRLLLTPPVPGDGHLLLREPGRWRDTLDAFLAEIAGAAQRSSAGR